MTPMYKTAVPKRDTAVSIYATILLIQVPFFSR